MSRRRGKSLAPSLFPFLAVLVCTLGTLILLLALVAQNATDTTEQQANATELKDPVVKEDDQPQRLSAETVNTLLREENFRVNELVSFREQQTADLERRRDELTYLEEQMNQLREQLRIIGDEVDRATGVAETELIDEQSLVALKEEIEQQRKVVEELQADSDDQSPRVVIVPHKGPNGTDRRPIYLECDADGIKILPEGSKITMSELEGAAYSANPLDAALRTIRLHAMKNYGDPVSPYPLLIVRPDGIAAYAAARQAMRDWDDQFGYELVPGEVKLGYGESDSNLKRRVDVAIRTAVKQQTAQQSIARQFGGSGGRSAFGNGRSPYGSSSTTPGNGRRSRLPVLSAAQLDREGRSGGFGSLREPRSMAGQRSLPAPITTPNTMVGGTIGSGVNNNPYATGGAYSGTGGDESAETARRWAEQMQSAAQEMRQNRSGSSGTFGGDSSSQFADSSPNQATNDPSGSVSDPNFISDSQSTREQTNQQRSPTAIEELTNQTAGNSDSQASSRGGSQGRSSTFSMSATGSSNQASPSMSAAQAGQMSASMSRSADSQRQQAPSINVPDSVQESLQRAQRQMVRRQGRDWALPAHMAGMSGGDVVRSIRAECYGDRFVLPPSKNGSMEIIGLDNGDVDTATLRLATALRDRIDRWGPALPGARWQPRLEVTVHPGGEPRFQQLQSLMTGSGIEVIRRSTR
ncbi:MAG: hypothetical protein AAGI63_09775 [Planctomycetota bacterium]